MGYLLKSGPLDHKLEIFYKRGGMSEEWTRGPLNIFGKFVQNNVSKQPFVYILGPLSHRHPLGCLLKNGPLDHKLEIF